MNINRIENDELRHFIEKNPDANFKNIVDFCKQKFDTAIAELISTHNRNLQNSLDSSELRGTSRKLQNVMEPSARQTRNIRDYQNLQDSATHQMDGFVNEVDTIASSHAESFIKSLRDVIDTEFDEIRTFTPNSRTDLNSVYSHSDRNLNNRKDMQNSDDKKMVAKLSDRVLNAKRAIHAKFVELSNADIKMYGIIYEPGRVSQNKNLIESIRSKVTELANVFNSSSQFFQNDITHALIQDNEGILQEVHNIMKDCRNIMNEAVYQISKDAKEEELRKEDQRRLDIKNKMKKEDEEIEARREERKKEEQQLEARIKAKREEERSESIFTNQKSIDDISNIRFKYDKDNVLLEPSDETYKQLTEAGMPRNAVPKYIWDRFVRTIDADEQLRFGEITQDAYNKELETIQKIEEILFSELVAGVEFNDARTTAEDVVLHGKEYTPPVKQENAEFAYNFDNILISPSDETIKTLVDAGIPENYASAYIWDRFVRTTNLDANLKNGKVSQAEYDEKAEMINRIEELLFDGLVEGKTIEEARAVAENRAAREDAVAIVPSPEAQQQLEAAGLSSENAKRYVWDRFVRVQLIDEALEKGQITEEEKQEQIAKVDIIEKALVDELRAGKSFAEARRNAETGKKSALQDIGEDTSITTTKVNNANNFMKAETRDKPLETDYII